MAQTPALLFAEGDVIDYTPSSAVAAGDVILIGSIPMIAEKAIAANVKGSLACEGIFKIPQKAEVFTAGDAVYWDVDGTPVTGDSASGAATGTASAGYLIGTAAETTAVTDTYVKTLLSKVRRSTTVGGAVTAADIAAEDATFTIVGLQAAQGGLVSVTGGTSTTSGNAGGAVSLVGGTPGITGAGGAASVTAGTGGTTSGTAGAATLVGGAGNGTTNGAGGTSAVTGGAGKGNAAGGAASLVGGVGGATGAGGAIAVTGGIGGSSSGAGGAVTVAGGAGTAGNGNGGAVTVTGGAKHSSGANGAVGIGSDKATVVTIGYASGKLMVVGLPTSDPSNSGEVWLNSNVLTKSA
jgi:predicted RecA/RadA family phage recombinase